VIKHYCDSCDKEIHKNVVSDRLIGHVQRGGKKIMFEIILGVDDTWNAGDVCKSCALDIVASALGAPKSIRPKGKDA